jgi:hypothetical protein
VSNKDSGLLEHLLDAHINSVGAHIKVLINSNDAHINLSEIVIESMNLELGVNDFISLIQLKVSSIILQCSYTIGKYCDH